MVAGSDISWLQWLVSFNDVSKLWAAQPTFLISQATYMLAALVSLNNALQRGRRWPYLWFGSLLHGLYADNFWHFAMPELDNFWHSQTPIMLLGGRLPLHIVFLYDPVFMYQAAYAISKLNLPRYAEPFAVGLLVVLINLPYDITAVKFVHWTWHDTDPNIYDRHYWVPWNSYYFHATFSASFVYIFHASRRWFAPTGIDQWKSASKSAEWKYFCIAALLGMPGGVLMFVPTYHPLHDVLNVHSEVTLFLLAAIFGGIVLHGMLRHRDANRLTKMDYALISQLVIHYSLYWVLVTFYHPEREVSTGLHEPVGPCSERASLSTPFGQTLYKNKYFCLEQYDEGYFDFHCVQEKPSLGASWYTICETPFENRAEYIVVISTVVVFATAVFYSIYFTSRKPGPNNTKRKTM